MNKAKRILTISEAQIKELSPADLIELEEELDEIKELAMEMTAPDTEPSVKSKRRYDRILELIGGIKYTLGLMGSGRA